MTPFMQQVEDVVSGRSSRPETRTVDTSLRTLGAGLHNQVELRALSEQLVSEGNVVLRDRGLLLHLEDEVSGDRLAFSVGCGRSRALVVTEVVGRTAAAFVTVAGVSRGRQEIAGLEALAGLLLSLVAGERAATA